MTLAHKMLIGLLTGVVAGLLLKEHAVHIKFLGDIFINLIKMVAMPLIFLTLTSGILNIKDGRILRKIGTKALLGFWLTAMCALVTGFFVYMIIQPGNNVVLPIDLDKVLPPPDTGAFSLSIIVNKIIPQNIFGAFVEGSILQVAFVAIFTAFTIRSIGPKENKKIVLFIREITKVVFRMIHYITQLAPLGAFGLTAWLIGTQGLDTLFNLGGLIKTIFIAYCIQYITIGLLILLIANLSPLNFYRKSIEYQLIALSTGSTKATLASSMQICQSKLGVSKNTTALTLPIGASINMDGACIYIVVSCLFLAQSLGIDLSIYEYITLVLLSTVGTIGTAGLSGGSLIVLPIVMAQIRIPAECYALLIAIDPILNAMRSVINITGDTAVALVVDKTENKLDENIYNEN